MQKIEKCGMDGNRFYWTVNVQGEGTGTYRSRHSTSKGVRQEFAKHGKKIVSIRATKV